MENPEKWDSPFCIEKMLYTGKALIYNLLNLWEILEIFRIKGLCQAGIQRKIMPQGTSRAIYL